MNVEIENRNLRTQVANLSRELAAVIEDRDEYQELTRKLRDDNIDLTGKLEIKRESNNESY